MDFTNPHFEEPGWLLLAVVAPVLLLALQRYSTAARKRQLARMASPRFIAELTRSQSAARRRGKEVLLVLATACIGLALARPQWGELDTAKRWSNEDVVIALDCSKSMLAADVLPNRLQRAKLAIRDFVQRHGRGRFGLVAFAGSAFLQCPLTLDYDAFNRALEAVDEKIIAVEGTDVGRALTEAYHAMDKKSRRKLVVLVTDGEDLEQTGVKAATWLTTNGVVVFTVGVGTPAGTEIRVLNATGQTELLRDAKGGPVRSRLDEATLQAIAKATGGNYYPLGVRGDGLDRVRFAVESLNRAAGWTYSYGIERFYVPLAAALLFVVVESLIGTRRRKQVTNHKLAGAHTSLHRNAVLASLILLGFCLSTWGETSDATNAVKSAATKSVPKTARDFYNAGTRKLNDGKWLEAETLLRMALTGLDEGVQPATLYNLGEVRFALGNELLKQQSSPESFVARARRISGLAAQVTQRAETALAGDDVQKMVDAYRAGRGVRREARRAVESINRAMEQYGATLLKWRRSLGDFQSVVELNPADTNAVYNAKVVEEAIARLVDKIHQLQQMVMPVCGKRSKFSEGMNQLKCRIPKDKMPTDLAEDEDEDMPVQLPRSGMEPPPKEGKEMQLDLSPEEAASLLRGMRLNERHGLPQPRGDAGQPRNRSGRTW